MHSDLSALGWHDGLATAFEPFHRHVPARVSRVDRAAIDVLVDPASAPVRAVADHVVGADLAVGDWVALDPDRDPPTVAAVLPRRTAIRRAAASGRSEAQLLAANVDVVLVTVPAVPEPRIGMVDRMIALAWDSGATPVIVLTKSDLHPESAAVAADLADDAPGVDVVTVDAVSETGAQALAARLVPGLTLALLGKSGAGKSTLVNLLADRPLLATGDVRRDGKGRHTTTHRELVVLPGGGILIDTPGLRGAGLWAGADGVEQAFADVETLAAECRFRDCAHGGEPGCAVQLAVDDGRLTRRRLDSWHKLRREAQWIAARSDARLAAEQRRAWKLVGQEVRRSGRTRP